jgi:predicted membrane protein
MGMADTGKIKNKDKSRKWMWWFLGVIAALQVYFVRELLAAFVLFALAFAAIALVIGSLYMLHKTWALAVERMAESQHPVMVAARQGMDTIEDMARRPFRRPGSAAAR